MALLIALAPATHALILDGGAVFLAVKDQTLDPTLEPTTADERVNAGFWTTSFDQDVSAGRLTIEGDFGYEQSATGLQFDVFSLASAIGSTGDPYTLVLSDRASVQVQVAFTLASSTDYLVSGDWSGTGEAGNLGGGTFASITRLQPTPAENLYLESANNLDANGFSYSFGDGTPTNGVRSGTLGPGSYRFVWESQTVDSFFEGGGLAASSSANMTFQLGEFTAVPGPQTALVLLIGWLLIPRTRRPRSWT